MEGDNYRRINKILLIVLGLNVLVSIIKIYMGYLIKSNSLTADGFHSMADGGSNIVALIGIKLASKPEDKEHPYGHKKFETFAGVIIGMMLVVLVYNTIVRGIGGFLNPSPPEVTPASLVSLVITLIINIFVSTYENREGKRLNSDVLVSDSLHTRSDIFISLGVLITLVLIGLGAPPVIDSVISIIVSVFILYSAYGILSNSAGVLLDRAVVDESKIRDLVMSFPQVRGCHKIRSRGRKDQMYIELHILVDPHMSIHQSHDLEHKIEDRIRERFNKQAQVVAHMEPFYSDYKSRKFKG